MWIQIDLVLQVFDIQFAYIVPDQGERHDEGKTIRAVAVDHFRKFGPVAGGELLAKVAREVLQHVGVIPPRGCVTHHGAKGIEILRSQLPCGDGPLRLADQVSKASHSGLLVRHEQELMAGVKLQDSSTLQSLFHEIHPALVTKDLRHEVFPEPRIVQAAFFLHRESGKAILKARRE